MKSTLNVALLKKVKQHILEEPNRLIMGNWIERNKPGNTILDYEGTITTPQCGTAACIAGWCVLLSEGMDFRVDWEVRDRATKILGLTETPCELFFTDLWEDQDASED